MTKVLLIDDEERCAMSVKLLLYGTRFQLLTAHSAERALELLKSSAQDIECILLDLKMPGASGIELMNMIQEIPDAANIPIIMQTGLFSYGEFEKFNSLGAAGCVIKPYSKLELICAIEKALLN